ncbi:MAG: putative zinc-binding metallopeptidase [Carboxylicivirga sp.]|jgi:substrate import-associated zinc metallohydrolase lipoprotein|nr:putative zinc-binding metallopeptidase [Carboxylicivirga sp.]
MKKLYNILLVVVAFLFVGCNQEADLLKDSVIYTNESGNTELDTWIMDNLTAPYNVEVIWKWNDNTIGTDKFVVPARAEKAQEFLQAYLDAWIKPYEAVVGEHFVKKYGFKQFVIAGSPSYNQDGTVTLGFAESGRKVVILNVNKFEPTNKSEFANAFHVIHHEFAHILHQLKFYPEKFKAISSDYRFDWYTVNPFEANDKGFVTPYSMASEEEDFVETYSAMTDRTGKVKTYSVPKKDADGKLMTDDPDSIEEVTRSGFEHYIQYGKPIMVDMEMTEWEHYLYMLGIKNTDSNPDLWWIDGYIQSEQVRTDGLPKIKRKESIVDEYFNGVWKINIRALQDALDDAAEDYLSKNG